MFVIQMLEFSAASGQFADSVLPLRNAGAIDLDVSLESQTHADKFIITPEQCRLLPRDNANIYIRFHAPTSPAVTVYERSVSHLLLFSIFRVAK